MQYERPEDIRRIKIENYKQEREIKSKIEVSLYIFLAIISNSFQLKTLKRRIFLHRKTDNRNEFGDNDEEVSISISL